MDDVTDKNFDAYLINKYYFGLKYKKKLIHMK